MSRIDTMARFEEPEEVKPVCTCDWCEAELYKGTTAYKIEGFTYCSTECLIRGFAMEVIL